MRSATQLETALLNLCVCARDAMPKGGNLLIELTDVDLGVDGARKHDIGPGPMRRGSRCGALRQRTSSSAGASASSWSKTRSKCAKASSSSSTASDTQSTKRPTGGGEPAAAISCKWPATGIVFMSGYTHDAIAGHGDLEAGSSLLSKPFSKSELARMIR